jgi:sulfur-oxidizing protein SoxY
MHRPASRREFLKGAGTAAVGLGVAAMIRLEPAHATPDELRAAIRTVVGAAPVTPGRVKLDVPPLIENGNAVPLTLSVESPMTEADHVRALHVFTEKNPQPYVASFHLGPRSGRARVTTRMRLADTQAITAICELSDGSFWSASASVVVTLAACLEGGV